MISTMGKDRLEEDRKSPEEVGGKFDNSSLSTSKKAKEKDGRDSKHKNRRRRDSEKWDDSSDEDEEKDRRRDRKRSRDRDRNDEDRRGRRHKKEHRKRSKKSSRYSSRSRRRRDRDDDDESASSSESYSSSEDDRRRNSNRNRSSSRKINERLAAKLEARGETLDERKQRRAIKAEQKRAAFIATKFGYTAEENPFHDPNLHQAFTWKKKEEASADQSFDTGNDTENGRRKKKKPEETTTATLEEIEKLRERRKQRELQLEEMERIRREESRMKELENFDEWARKEEVFHLQQQRQRSAIRLVQGREKPIDVLAQNILLFGVDRDNQAAVKYKERYNALDELEENLHVELEEPYKLLHMLKKHELEDVLVDIDAFLVLEREAAGQEISMEDKNSSSVLLNYWLALKTVALDELKFLQSGGDKGSHATMVRDVCQIFPRGQSTAELEKMKVEVQEKLRNNGLSKEHSEDEFGNSSTAAFDREYWQTVLGQLDVHLAKKTLSEIHSKMLVRQLERLEQKRKELANMPKPKPAAGEDNRNRKSQQDGSNVEETEEDKDEDGDGFGDVEEHELKEATGDSPSLRPNKSYSWADKYRPRKPRYFNRVKTGYDWNKYNKTHYDRDNPPPKTVQGYKFNIFYPDLIDPSKTPHFELLKADSDEFCIIRFSAGPPYQDVAFKIINREWNKSRKHGFKSTFERGILSLYFNFKTSWYRR